MRIDGLSGGGGEMMSRMQQIRQNGGMTREDLAEFQAKAEEVGGPGKEHFAKISENFDAIDADKDGKLTKTEMDEYAEANGIEPPPPPPRRGGPPPFVAGAESEQSESALWTQLAKSSDDSEGDSSTASSLESNLLQSLMKKALSQYSSDISYNSDYASSLFEVS